MLSNDYFLQNQDDEVFSPIDANLIRLKISELDPTNGSFLILQNKLKVGEFFQCVASDERNYLCEAKINDILFQCESITTLAGTISLMEMFIQNNLKTSKGWKKIIL